MTSLLFVLRRNKLTYFYSYDLRGKKKEVVMFPSDTSFNFLPNLRRNFDVICKTLWFPLALPNHN
jgi:hypothetical protein